VRSRLIIHAGFAKCGNASIRAALFQNFRKLQKHNVFVFDKNLRIARAPEDLIGTSIWSVGRARKKTENLTQRLGDEIAAVSSRKAEHVAILSAENLANPGMAELFAGLESQFEVWVHLVCAAATSMDTIGMEAVGPENRRADQRFCFSMHQGS